MTSHRAFLLIEDIEDDIFLTTKALALAGVENPIRVVRDGKAALDYLSGTGEFGDRSKYPLPAIVFLDLTLPNTHGLEVLRWIRADQELKETVVIVLTASRANSDVAEAYRLGANSFLRKPLSGE